MSGIEKDVTKKLESILLRIASADANEVLKWGKEQIARGDSKIKMSKNMACAVSSIKMKANGDGIDCDIKFFDKLKAIELYFKLLGIDNSGENSDAIYIDYDYKGDEN